MSETKEIAKEVIKEVIPEMVTVKQFKSTSNWLDPDHDGHLRYQNTSEFLTVQNQKGMKRLNTGLTPELQRSLEKKLNLPGASEKMPQGTLSPHNEDFWGTFRMEMPKGERTLYPASNAQHELEWRVMLVHDQIANSEADRISGAAPFAKYVLTSKEEEAKEINKKVSKNRKAYSAFGEMTVDGMKDFLKVYGGTYNLKSKVGDGASADFIEAEVGKIVENDTEKFLDVINQKDFKQKVFIYKCLDANLLKKDKSKYSLHGGDVIGFSLEETINYLSDKNNQEVVLHLKSQLEAN